MFIIMKIIIAVYVYNKNKIILYNFKIILMIIAEYVKNVWNN